MLILLPHVSIQEKTGWRIVSSEKGKVGERKVENYQNKVDREQKV